MRKADDQGPSVRSISKIFKSTVLYLTGLEPPRSYDHPESLGKAVSFISDKFREYGLDPEIQAFSARDRMYENVVASLGPRARKRLIIGAHYDVAGHRPGADDNASGVAGLLEIARSIKEFEPNLSYRVDLVAYALEEPPFFSTDDMGSYIHAKSLKDNDVDVKGMISLEAIGFFTDEKGSQSFPASIVLNSFIRTQAILLRSSAMSAVHYLPQRYKGT